MTVSSSNESRVQATLERLKSAYPSAPSRIAGHVCDLSRDEELEAHVKGLFEATGEVDHVAFTAGNTIPPSAVSDLTVDYIRARGTVRFVAPLIVAKSATKYLRSGLASSLTLTTGALAENPMANWSAVAGYAAGMHGLTRNLALDMRPIRVNCVSPGPVGTEMFDAMPADQREQLHGLMASMCLTGRMGQPEDVAESYLTSMRD